MKTLLAATALIEFGAGGALLCFPVAAAGLLVEEPLGGPAAAMLARVGGAAIVALGMACWLARGDTNNRAARGLVVAMTFYNVAAVAVLGAGGAAGLRGLLLWPGVALHAVMAVWCAECLRRSGRNSTNDGKSP